MAMALVRYGFRGRSTVDFFVFLPLSTPEVVIGAALLALFLTAAVNTGFATIVIAHVMFTVSYVVVTVKARLEGMDRHIEEAAMDLGATEWTTFRKVTLPMIAPGVAAAALLAAAISVDDYVITSFNAGQTMTFPLFIFGATRQGVPPEVNVLATGLLLIVLVLMGLNVMLQRRLARRDAARTAADPQTPSFPPSVVASKSGPRAGRYPVVSMRADGAITGVMSDRSRWTTSSPPPRRGSCPLLGIALVGRHAGQPTPEAHFWPGLDRRRHRRRRRGRRYTMAGVARHATAARSCSAPRSRRRPRCSPSTASRPPA